MVTTIPTLDSISALLSRLRLIASSESDLQEQINDAFSTSFKGAYAREYRLSAKDRPDFFFSDLGLVVEVKIGRSGGNATHVWQQIARYAEHDSVRRVLFVTPSARVAQVLPTEISGVPISTFILNTGF